MNVRHRLSTRFLAWTHLRASFEAVALGTASAFHPKSVELSTSCFAMEPPERRSTTPLDVGLETAQPPIRPGRGSLGLRALSLLLLCALGLVVAIRGGAFNLGGVQALLASMSAEVETRTLIMLALVYAVALALPFVPGVELGLLLMVAFGPRGVMLVYLASLLGLSLSYAAGRLLPAHLPAQQSQGIGTPATPDQDTTTKLQSLVSGNRLARCLPIRLMGWLASHRLLALAISLNLPGNVVIGGGGGIALLCGVSGQYRYRHFLTTIAVAVSPVPILMLLGILGPDLIQLASHWIGETPGCLLLRPFHV